MTMKRMVGLDEAPEYVPPGHYKGVDKVLVSRETTGARNLEVWYGYLEPDATVAPHSHINNEQVYFVIKGKVSICIEGEKMIGLPFKSIFIERGAEHSVEVLGEYSEVLIITSPPPEKTSQEN